MLDINCFEFSYDGENTRVCNGVSLSVKSGECVCLTGPSGCGKTTLLLAIKGLLRGGTSKGTIKVNTQESGNGTSHSSVGLVFQNVESQILCTTVAEEVAFGPENLCIPSDEIGRRIDSSLSSVGLSGFVSRNVERMSAGQKQRLAIASVLAMEPTLLLLDEPTSQLDGEGKKELVEIIKNLKKNGHALLITEHDLAPLKEVADRIHSMAHIAAAKDNIEKHAETKKSDVQSHSIVAEDVSLSYPGMNEVLKGVNLTVNEGERVHLYGRNGAGKSTLLKCLAGITRPDSGRISIAGIDNPRPRDLPGKVAFLFQNPTRQLFENTVFDEVAFSLKRLKVTGEELKQRVEEALSVCEVSHLAKKPPLMLSFGEQHRVAFASVLAPKPKVLLLDEPFSGLDISQRHRFLGVLSEVSSLYNTTIVIASHDPLPQQGWAQRILKVENGKIA